MSQTLLKKALHNISYGYTLRWLWMTEGVQ